MFLFSFMDVGKPSPVDDNGQEGHANLWNHETTSSFPQTSVGQFPTYPQSTKQGFEGCLFFLGNVHGNTMRGVFPVDSM